MELVICRSRDHDITVGKKDQKTSKSKKSSKSIKTLRSLDFLILRVRLALTKLKQVFVKVLIPQHFNLEYHIRIETDVSGYTIDKVLSQLTLDDLGQWYFVIFFSQKIIPVETRYKIYNSKLSAIVKDFKTWKHYLEGF